MAQQKGIFKVKGALGDVSFYKSQDGYLIREKTSLDGNRIAHDPAFARTRENNAEFTRAAQAGKLLRQALRPLIKDASDGRIVSRLTRYMAQSIRMDSSHARGERTVTEHISLLQGFEFNINGRLSSTLYVPFTNSIDRAAGTLGVNLEAYRATAMIAAPDGTTHYQLHMGGALLDFDQQTFEVQFANGELLVFDSTDQAAGSLSVTLSGGSTAPLFLCLGISFSQEVNGQQYALKNGVYNALAVVQVDAGT